MNFYEKDDELSLDRYSRRRPRSYSENEKSSKNTINLSTYFDMSDIEAMNPEENIDEPEKIQIFVNSSTSLISIHKGIRLRFVYEKTKISGLNIELESLETIKNKIDRETYISRKNSLIREIKRLDTERKWLEYKRRITPILERYCRTIPPDVRGIISFKKQSEDEIMNCLNCITEYIEISNSICNIQIECSYQSDKKMFCEICENSSERCSCSIVEDNIEEIIDESKNSKNYEKQTNTCPKSQIEWLKNFMGEGDYSHFNEDYFEYLDELCTQNNLPTSDYVKSNPLYGTRELLKKILKLANLEYKHANALAFRYWEWPQPQINEDQIEIFKRDTIQTRKEYPKVSEKKQNLNLDLSGYLLLGLQKLVFPEKYYSFPSNYAIIRRANKIWIETCKNLEITEYILIK